MKKLLMVISSILILTGCATKQFSPIKITKDKMAINFMLLDKKIVYSETLYRGLYLEYTSSQRDISPMWDVDKELSAVVYKKIIQKNSQANNIYTLTNKLLINQYSTAFQKDYVLDIHSRELEPGLVIPAKTKIYLYKYPEYKEFDSLRQNLLSKGINYLFEYISPNIDASAPGMGMVMIGMTSNLRIINLKTKKVEWVDTTRIFENYQLGGELRKIEENNLSLLKQSLKKNMNTLLDLISFQ